MAIKSLKNFIEGINENTKFGIGKLGMASRCLASEVKTHWRGDLADHL